MVSDVRKIAVVIPKYGLVGGAESFAAELTERIALNTRYNLHVFANRWTTHSERITFHKVPIFSFPKFLTTISFAYFAGLNISKMNFDLIHTHDRIFDADILSQPYYSQTPVKFPSSAILPRVRLTSLPTFEGTTSAYGVSGRGVR